MGEHGARPTVTSKGCEAPVVRRQRWSKGARADPHVWTGASQSDGAEVVTGARDNGPKDGPKGVGPGQADTETSLVSVRRFVTWLALPFAPAGDTVALLGRQGRADE